MWAGCRDTTKDPAVLGPGSEGMRARGCYWNPETEIGHRSLRRTRTQPRFLSSQQPGSSRGSPGQGGEGREEHWCPQYGAYQLSSVNHSPLVTFGGR